MFTSLPEDSYLSRKTWKQVVPYGNSQFNPTIQELGAWFGCASKANLGAMLEALLLGLIIRHLRCPICSMRRLTGGGFGSGPRHFQCFFPHAAMSSTCERPEIKKCYKQFGRYVTARPPVGDVHRDGHCVLFTAQNGYSYQVDVSKMQQRNLTTGNVRAVSFQPQEGWFFDKSGTSPARWLPYARSLHRVLDAAYADVATKPRGRECHEQDSNEDSGSQAGSQAGHNPGPVSKMSKAADPLAACREALEREGALQAIEAFLDAHPALHFSVREARSAALSGQVGVGEAPKRP